MANELKAVLPGYTGSTLYAVLLDADGDAWNGAAFETLEGDNYDDYALAMTEQDGLGIFYGDLPAVDAGEYTYLVYDQAGVSEAGTDEPVAQGVVDTREGLTAAQVNAEVLDVMNVDTFAEPGQGAPPATASLAAKIGYLFKAFRNKSTQTATQYSLYNDAGDTIDQKATTSDDGTTFNRGEVGAGP